MSGPEPIQLLGAAGSPYTRKMIALLRYRRIPYGVHWGSHRQTPSGLPEAKVKLLPTVYLPDETGGLEALVDSTPIIARLEVERAGRHAHPDDPVLGFLNALIEDYADEWLTKAMFHYRWAHDTDAREAGHKLIYWHDPQTPDAMADVLAKEISQRQINRLYVVGSNGVTGPVIEASYTRLLSVLDQLVQRRGYVLGARPSSADFALYGQLTQLAIVDPTPAALCQAKAPRLRAWVDRVEDLSGLDPKASDWMARDELASALGPLLSEIGRVYAPFLLANAQAVQNSAPAFETTIDAQPWTQPTFPYQAKCLGWLRDHFFGLSGADQAACRTLMAGTGCDKLFD